jgi:RNA polymerase sigma factor (sigma-70 family)
MDAEQLFLENLGLIDRIVAFVCRRNHYRDDEAEDFAGHVRLKLIENDYSILRKFEGRSSFSTYLTTVIQRMSFQYRVQMWGKWRPSAEAQRLGDAGITLERLITRDGYSLHEAVQMLTTRSQPAFSRAELEAAYARLPHRTPRPVLVHESDAAHAIASTSDSEADAVRRDRERSSRAVAAAIDSAMATMDPEDQIILRMRFWSARSVPDIAAALQLDQKKLYKRIDRLLVALRKSLEAAGLGRRQIEDVLESGEIEIRFSEGNRALSRSQSAEAPVREEGKQSR